MIDDIFEILLKSIPKSDLTLQPQQSEQSEDVEATE